MTENWLTPIEKAFSDLPKASILQPKILDLNYLNSSFIHHNVASPIVLSATIDLIDPFTQSETLLALKSIKNNVIGPDGLSSTFLHICANEVSGPLTLLYNQCLSEGKIPDSWRCSKITPIPKGNSIDKFRPIASTPSLLKTLEAILLKHFECFDNNDALQFAFRRRRSTVDCLATLVHNIAFSLDGNRGAYRCCFLDFSSAFNTIDRGLIVDKLLKSDF